MIYDKHIDKTEEAPNYQSRQDAKSVMHLIAFSFEAASDGNPDNLTSMHHT